MMNDDGSLRRSEAYYDGELAGEEGMEDCDNPFPIGSDEAMDWYDGWFSAVNY